MFSSGFVGDSILGKRSRLLVYAASAAAFIAYVVYWFNQKDDDNDYDFDDDVLTSESCKDVLSQEDSSSKCIYDNNERIQDIILLEKEEEDVEMTSTIAEENSVSNGTWYSVQSFSEGDEEEEDEEEDRLSDDLRLTPDVNNKATTANNNTLCEEEEEDHHHPISSQTNHEGGGSNCSDSGRGSEVDDPHSSSSSTAAITTTAIEEVTTTTGAATAVVEETAAAAAAATTLEALEDSTMILSYQFYIPSRLCGRLIGTKGSQVNSLKKESKCSILLKDIYNVNNNKRQRKKIGIDEDPPQLCIVEGTRANIEKCLEIIRSRFPLAPDFTLEQVNLSGDSLWSNGSPALSLNVETTNEITVTAIVSPNHLFCQMPKHPTYDSLERLNQCMYHCYTESTTPELLRPVDVGVICVAEVSDYWWRVQVVTYDETTDFCDIKFLDYGGYASVSATKLRQIRSDYLALPFQAIECYLANIAPPNNSYEWPLESGAVMEQLLSYKVVKADVLGVADDGIPLTHLFISKSSSEDEEKEEDEQYINVNQELVERQVATWVELKPFDVSV